VLIYLQYYSIADQHFGDLNDRENSINKVKLKGLCLEMESVDKKVAFEKMLFIISEALWRVEKKHGGHFFLSLQYLHTTCLVYSLVFLSNHASSATTHIPLLRRMWGSNPETQGRYRVIDSTLSYISTENLAIISFYI
jgi:hypothetical protein